MAEAKEKRPKIRCGEMEEGEAFRYKGGLFKVLRTFRCERNPDLGYSKVLILKPCKVTQTKKKHTVRVPLPKGQVVSFNHGRMVRRYEPPVTFQ